MSERKRSPLLIAGIVACVLLASIGAYVVGYLWLVVPAPYPWASREKVVYIPPIQVDTYIKPEDSHRVLKGLFAPVHWLDERLRPQIWDQSHPNFWDER